MGQYYEVAIETESGLDCFKFSANKLMEFSYIENASVNGLVEKIANKKSRVYVIGDYWEDQINDLVDMWSDDRQKARAICEYFQRQPFDRKEVLYSEICFDAGYLVNYSKGAYIDLAGYCERCKDAKYGIIAPLPLLCAIGNGCGGGDYYGVNKEFCGKWVGDWIGYEETLESAKVLAGGLDLYDLDALVFKED